jgi:hypothetical protein
MMILSIGATADLDKAPDIAPLNNLREVSIEENSFF